MTDHVFGIDLGTTYSAVAFTNDFGQSEVVRNREGEETTPSVVFFENESNFVVGKEAKNEILLHPDTTVALIKRHMGTDFSLDFFGRGVQSPRRSLPSSSRTSSTMRRRTLGSRRARS